MATSTAQAAGRRSSSASGTESPRPRPRPPGVLKLKWTICWESAGIQIHADPATAATPAGWVGARAWVGRLSVAADLLSRSTRVEEFGLAPRLALRVGPLRLRVSGCTRGPDVVARVMADLLTPAKPGIGSIRRHMPWLEITGTDVARAWWWPDAVAEAVRVAAEAELGQAVRLS